MNSVEQLHRARPYPSIRVESTASGQTHWMYMHSALSPGDRPCFRPELMQDMWRFLDSVTSHGPPQTPDGLRHVVVASDADAFNLGGDLALFAHLIRSRDREHLLAYARTCIDGVHHIHSGLGGDVRTIALIEGDALGGGLELALACQTIVAEEGVDMGLPEVLFGLFPGMGAYSFLARRVPPHLAERLILDGEIFSSDAMHAMGIVDILVPKGHGAEAVDALIQRQQRAPHAHIALNAVRAVAQPVTHHELMAITELWVDTALALGDRSLRMMDRIVKAQSRRTYGVRAGAARV